MTDATATATASTGTTDAATASTAGGSQTTTTAATAGVEAATAPPPEGPLASFWDKDKGSFDVEKLSAAYTERDTVFAQHAERMKGVPEKPEAYEAKPILPEGIAIPQGAELKFDDKAVAAAAGIAHQLGIPQEAFSKLLGVVAAHQIQNAQSALAEHQSMVAAENKKLGEGGPQRRGAIESFVKANGFGADEQAEVRLLLSTEAGVRALERFMAKANGAAMPGNRQDPPAAKPEPVPTAVAMYPTMQRKS